jgi:hypothetical protein
LIKPDNEKKISKILEDLPDFTSFCSEIKSKIGAINSNMKAFNEREKLKKQDIQEFGSLIRR